MNAQQFVSSLTPSQIAYAASTERGEFRGFAALHDLFDANEALPNANNASADPVWIANAEKFMAEVTALLLTPQTALERGVSIALRESAVHNVRACSLYQTGPDKFCVINVIPPRGWVLVAEFTLGKVTRAVWPLAEMVRNLPA